MDVDKFEDELRGVERKLDELGCKICSNEKGDDSWYAINMAIENVQAAIHRAYKMRD